MVPPSGSSWSLGHRAPRDRSLSRGGGAPVLRQEGLAPLMAPKFRLPAATRDLFRAARPDSVAPELPHSRLGADQ